MCSFTFICLTTSQWPPRCNSHFLIAVSERLHCSLFLPITTFATSKSGLVSNVGPEVINFFILNSAEHEILCAPKYKYIKKFSFLMISLECYFVLLINVKAEKISCLAELSIKNL